MLVMPSTLGCWSPSVCFWAATFPPHCFLPIKDLCESFDAIDGALPCSSAPLCRLHANLKTVLVSRVCWNPKAGLQPIRAPGEGATEPFDTRISNVPIFLVQKREKSRFWYWDRATASSAQLTPSRSKVLFSHATRAAGACPEGPKNIDTAELQECERSKKMWKRDSVKSRLLELRGLFQTNTEDPWVSKKWGLVTGFGSLLVSQ